MNSEKKLICGAGACGKTEFLLEKFETCLKAGATPSRICVFCRIPIKKYFLEKVKKNSPSGYREIFIDTFSAFAKRAVRKSHYLFAIPPDFTVISGREEEIIIRDVLAKPFIKSGLKHFKSSVGFSGFRKELIDFIDKFKISPADCPPPGELFAVVDEYNRSLKEKNLLDLRDIENLCLKTVSEGLFDDSFDYIFLDGWEDLNKKEVEIFFKLLEKSVKLKGVFCAGDESSGIFEFLGADPAENGAIFREKFADDITTFKKKTFPETELKSFLTLFDEAEWILSEIRSLLSSGVAADDIAVIFRDISDEMKILEDMAAMESVPAASSAGAPFFKHPSFVSFLSFIFATVGIVEESSRDEMLKLPAFGLATADIFRLRNASAREREPLYSKMNKVISQATSSVADTKTGCADKIFKLFELSGLRKTVSGNVILSRLFGYFFEYVQKLEGLTETKDFKGFVSLLSETMRSFSRAPYLGDATGVVKLLTVHEAIGLRFKYSFVPGLLWGNFPRQFNPDVYIDLGRTEEKHYAVEEKIFNAAVRSALVKVYLSFRNPAVGSNIISPYLADFVKEGRKPADTKVTIFSLPAKMKRVKVSARNIKIPPPDKISVSALENYIECPFKYFADDLIGVKSPSSATLVCGWIVHRILERFHGEFPLPSSLEKMKKKMAELTEELFSASNIDADFDDSYTRKCWKEFFAKFLAKYAEETGKFEVAEREKSVEVEAKGLKLTGRIDRIDKIPAGFEIVDYKTSVSSKFAERALINRISDGRHIALPVYARSVKDCLRISIMFVADYEKPEKYPEKISADINDIKFIAAVKKMDSVISKAVEGIKRGVFSPSSQCKSKYGCRYSGICGFQAEDESA